MDNNENLRRSARIKTQVDYSDNEERLCSPESKFKGTPRQRRKSSNLSPSSSKMPMKNTPKKELKSQLRKDGESSIDKTPKKGVMFMQEFNRELEVIEEEKWKPSELFHDGDVGGNRIYGFQTPQKKNAMTEKAIMSRTPTKSKSMSSRKSRVMEKLVTKIDTTPSTPTSAVRKSMRLLLKKKQKRPTYYSSDSESVTDSSDYKASDVEESDDETDNENNSDIENRKIVYQTPKKNVQMKKTLVPITPCRRGRSKNTVNYRDYCLDIDDYFETQSQKILTSDHTLAKLKNPRIDEEKLQELLKDKNYICKEHKKGIRTLTENCKSMYPMWYSIMEEGYSLLLHGLGSKKNLIDDFHKEVISDHPTLIINGFFPSLTIKDILESILTELLELEAPGNLNDCFNIIEDILIKNPDDRLYLLIHNIDGPMLRSNKAQDMLSRLASISNVHVLASVDHINAPLMWENVKQSRYNFYWWDATTLLPYEAETLYESSLLIQRSGALALSSLHSVFASLTTNAKAIYKILLNYQLENNKNNLYSGMAFKDLYRGAREAFLVSSDIALRAQLTEFIDHKLVKTKRNIDGAEYLIIPLDKSLLQKFLEDQ